MVLTELRKFTLEYPLGFFETKEYAGIYFSLDNHIKFVFVPLDSFSLARPQVGIEHSSDISQISSYLGLTDFYGFSLSKKQQHRIIPLLIKHIRTYLLFSQKGHEMRLRKLIEQGNIVNYPSYYYESIKHTYFQDIRQIVISLLMKLNILERSNDLMKRRDVLGKKITEAGIKVNDLLRDFLNNDAKWISRVNESECNNIAIFRNLFLDIVKGKNIDDNVRNMVKKLPKIVEHDGEKVNFRKIMDKFLTQYDKDFTRYNELKRHRKVVDQLLVQIYETNNREINKHKFTVVFNKVTDLNMTIPKNVKEILYGILLEKKPEIDIQLYVKLEKYLSD